MFQPLLIISNQDLICPTVTQGYTFLSKVHITKTKKIDKLSLKPHHLKLQKSSLSKIYNTIFINWPISSLVPFGIETCNVPPGGDQDVLVSFLGNS